MNNEKLEWFGTFTHKAPYQVSRITRIKIPEIEPKVGIWGRIIAQIRSIMFPLWYRR